MACIAAKYPEKRAPVGSLGQRQANMEFLRDRIIEAGKCGGLDLGRNLKRGGPDISIDFLAWRRSDGEMGVDLGLDYDNIGITLQLYWGEAGLGATYTPYRAGELSVAASGDGRGLAATASVARSRTTVSRGAPGTVTSS